MKIDKTVKIEIDCKKPPIDLFWQIRWVMHWINQHDLRGLDKIVFAEDLPDFARSEDVHASRRGFYLLPTEVSPPTIILSILELYKGIPRLLLFSPLLRVQIVQTLAHEIGHHVALTKGQSRQSEMKEDEAESCADQYAQALLQHLQQSWLYRIGRWGLNELADWYFMLGLAAMRRSANKLAVKRFHLAWHLNNDHEYASDYYYQAFDNCDDVKPKQVSQQSKHDT